MEHLEVFNINEKKGQVYHMKQRNSSNVLFDIKWYLYVVLVRIIEKLRSSLRTKQNGYPI